MRGDPAGVVQLIVYTDFECPFCAEYHAILRDVVARTPGVRWTYRPSPARRIHPHSERAVVAATCADEQGRFWDYADGIFARHAVLGPGVFEEVAVEAGLDIDRFTSCLGAGSQSDLADEAERLGLAGTPTSFINGRRIDGVIDRDELSRAIESAR